jgi:uracil-DNA glycosylase
MSTQILPASSLRSVIQLPAGRARFLAPNYLICVTLWSIGRAIFGIVSNFLPVLREEGVLPGRVEQGANHRQAVVPGASGNSPGFMLRQASRPMPASHAEDPVHQPRSPPSDPAAELAFDRFIAEIRACTLCAPDLPLGPRPVLRGRPSARLLIISQAPGTRVHETGLSFNDRSGDRLRAWLALDRETFYDETRIAIAPMGFCYPGRDGKGGDLPPRRECAPLWHARLLAFFPAVELTLLVGSYAISHYLPGARAGSMTEVIARWREFLPEVFVLPHPSWRTTRWLRDNPWFETEALPELRARVAAAINPSPRSAPCPHR